MDVFLPDSLQEALEVKRDHPDAHPIAGGTDVMVEMNFDRIRPPAMVDLTRIPDLQRWRRDNGSVFLGSGVTYTRIIVELPELVPLVQASRTVGSPQIRNRGTVGGNLGTSSPAGDALPVLSVYEADVVLASAERGERSVPFAQFMTGPKRNAMDHDELILGARWPVVRGPGSFSKVGTRNAMVIAVAGLCLQIDEDRRAVRVALGSVGPTILRAHEAEAFVGQALAGAGVWDDPAADVPAAEIEEFGRLVSEAARPIDDVRGSAAYRRHVCSVLARRALGWTLEERRTPTDPVR